MLSTLVLPVAVVDDDGAVASARPVSAVTRARAMRCRQETWTSQVRYCLCRLPDEPAAAWQRAGRLVSGTCPPNGSSNAAPPPTTTMQPRAERSTAAAIKSPCLLYAAGSRSVTWYALGSINRPGTEANRCRRCDCCCWLLHADAGLPCGGSSPSTRYSVHQPVGESVNAWANCCSSTSPLEQVTPN